MSQSRQSATPVFLSDLKDGEATGLVSVAGSALTPGDLSHDEAWLQNLIHVYPEVLPIADIEPALSRLIPICRELPTGAGYADNLYLTGRGEIIIAECKLWRNPQSRREVVAQTIDYAAALSQLDYTKFEAAIALVLRKDRGFSLFKELEPKLDLGEADFVDAVTRNLRLGRFLLLVVGDGIREGVEALSEYLQRHAGFHFTLSLIEMPVFRVPTGGYVVLPRILAKTVNLERGIVTITDAKLTIEPPRMSNTRIVEAKRTTMSQELILDQLVKVDPRYPDAIYRFLDIVSDLGVHMEAKSKSLGFYWIGPDEKPYNVGAISVTGELWTDAISWKPHGFGRVDIPHKYLAAIAGILGGTIRKTPETAGWYVVQRGTVKPPAVNLLDNSPQWIESMRAYIDELRRALASSSLD